MAPMFSLVLAVHIGTFFLQKPLHQSPAAVGPQLNTTTACQEINSFLAL